MKALEVNQTFDTRQLPSHLDCYSMLAGYVVAIQGQHRPYLAIFDQETGRITCDCDQSQWYGTCDHLRALSAGLWPRLSLLSEDSSLITCTRAWCTDEPIVPARTAARH